MLQKPEIQPLNAGHYVTAHTISAGLALDLETLAFGRGRSTPARHRMAANRLIRLLDRSREIAKRSRVHPELAAYLKAAIEPGSAGRRKRAVMTWLEMVP